MKQLILIVTLALSINAYAQEDKTVTLTVSGQGKTQDESKQNALRSAIEQAFGAFISSNTEILNDELVKDEIVSVSNGNIQNFEIMSEVQIPDGGYATTLKATVSVTKLTSFVESKGFQVEFKGTLFSANIRQQKMNEDAELKSIMNLCEVSNEILKNSLDYSLDVSEPIVESDELYSIMFSVNIIPNKNFDAFKDYFVKSIRSIAMTASEIATYKRINKEIFTLILLDSSDTLTFRNKATCLMLNVFFVESNINLINYFVHSDIDTVYIRKGFYDRSNYKSRPANQNVEAGGYSTITERNKISVWSLNTEGRDWHDNRRESRVKSSFPVFIMGYSISNHEAYAISAWESFMNNIVLRDPLIPRIYWDIWSPYHKTNSRASTIGWLSFNKPIYENKYKAFYTLNDIMKITNFSVKQTTEINNLNFDNNNVYWTNDAASDPWNGYHIFEDCQLIKDHDVIYNGTVMESWVQTERTIHLCETCKKKAEKARDEAGKGAKEAAPAEDAHEEGAEE